MKIFSSHSHKLKAIYTTVLYFAEHAILIDLPRKSLYSSNILHKILLYSFQIPKLQILNRNIMYAGW